MIRLAHGSPRAEKPVGVLRAGFVCWWLVWALAGPAAMAAGIDPGWEPLFTDALFTDAEFRAALPAELAEAREVAPAALSRLRGRFVQADQIVYFGVDMVTQWQALGAEAQRVQLSLDVDWRRPSDSLTEPPGQPVVSLSLTGQSSGEPSALPSPPRGPVSDINGGVQSIQLQGDRNRAWNALEIDIQRGSPDPALLTQIRVPDGNVLGEDQSFQAASGFVTRVEVRPGRFGYRIQRSQQGDVVQMLTAQGIQQSIRLSSHDNQVENLLRLRIYQTDKTTSVLDGARNSLELLRHMALPRPF